MEESLFELAYSRQRFPYRRAREELRLFLPFYPPVGLGVVERKDAERFPDFENSSSQF